MSPTPRLAAALGASLAALLAPGVARAQLSFASELPTTTRMMALGGSAQALAQSTSGLYVNPAAMSLARTYHVDSSTLYDPSMSRWAFGGAIVDTTRMVSAGLAYSYSTADGRTHHDARLGVSILLTEGVALGVTGRYMNLGGPSRSNITQANGAAHSGLGMAFSGFTLDVGVAVRPVSFLTLAATGYSLTNPDTAASPLSVGGGVAITPVEGLSVAVDNVWDLRTFAEPRMRLGGGAEFLINRVPIRAGYLYDHTRGDAPVHTVTAGVGFLERAFGAELSLRQDVSGDNQTTLLLNLRYFYNPGG